VLSHDGTRVAEISKDGPVVVYLVESGDVEFQLDAKKLEVRGVEFCGTSPVLAVAFPEEIRLVDFVSESGPKVETVKSPILSPTMYFPDKRRLLVSQGDQVGIISLGDQSAVTWPVTGMDVSVTSIGCSDDGSRFSDGS
jgi:hypothetical protein